MRICVSVCVYKFMCWHIWACVPIYTCVTILLPCNMCIVISRHAYVNMSCPSIFIWSLLFDYVSSQGLKWARLLEINTIAVYFTTCVGKTFCYIIWTELVLEVQNDLFLWKYILQCKSTIQRKHQWKTTLKWITLYIHLWTCLDTFLWWVNITTTGPPQKSRLYYN